MDGYEILAELGRGGMGVVYKARHVGLNRLVALKMILSGSYAGPRELARFRAEAQTVASLQHPNIVQIHEVGEQNGRPFLALELVGGGRLDEKIAGKPLPPRQVAQFLGTLAQAVHAAHQKGIVHRDLKPANVLLTVPDEASGPLGSPKIADFGLAKRLDSQASQTQTGDVLGTPSYMAPEQAEGRIRQISPAADVYSLGTILYEMLTGRPPFLAATRLDTIMQVISQEPVPPRRLQPQVPRELETICLKCLEKDRSRRYISAKALFEDLYRFLQGQPIRARPIGPVGRLWRWCRREPALAVLAASLLLACVGGFVGVMAQWRRAEANFADAQRQHSEAVAALEREEVTRAKAQQQLAQLYTANGSRLLDAGDLLGSLVWFADAFRLDQEGFKLDAEGMATRETVHRIRLAAILRRCPKLVQFWSHRDAVPHVDFSPDGRRVLTASLDGTARVWTVSTGDAATPPLAHDEKVYYATFSPDGRRVVTASEDHTAKVWDAVTGRPIAPPFRHRQAIYHAAFSPDGHLVATASEDKTARVWDVDTGDQIGPALRHEGRVYRVAFSPDGRRVVTASSDRTTRIWDVATGNSVTPPLKHSWFVWYALFSPDGRRVLTASLDGTARVWNVATGAPITAPLRHHASVGRVAFSPDGMWVVTASEDRTARVWDASTGKPITPPLEHGGPVRNVAFSPDGQHLVTASADQTARVWDVRSGAPIGLPLRHGACVGRAVFSPDGRNILTACDDGGVRLWETPTDVPVARVLQHRQGLRHAGFSPDSRYLVTASEDQTARVWNTDSGAATSPLLKHAGIVHSAAFSPDSRRLATGSSDGTIRLWNAQTGELLGKSLVNGSEVLQVAFSPDGRRVAGANGGAVSVWEVDTGNKAYELEHETWVAFSLDGRRLVTVSFTGGAARVWDAATGEAVTPPLPHGARMYQAVFSPDGREVVTASAGQARVWDVETGAPLLPPLRHGDEVRRASFSLNGRRIITASDDGTARIWNAATGMPVTPSLFHGGKVMQAALSPDSRLAVTAGDDGTAKVWDAVTGMPIMLPLRHGGPLSHAEFSPDGRQLVTASADGTARLLNLARDDRPVEDLVLLAQCLASHRIEAGTSLVPLSVLDVGRLFEQLRRKYPKDFGRYDGAASRSADGVP